MTGDGTCRCGCGERTTIAVKTDRRASMVKGEPMAFVMGHNLRLAKKLEPVAPSWVVEDRGYSTPCWIWTGSIQLNGYGEIRNPVREFAHRWSWRQHRGPIPPGMQIDHLCKVRCCMNPDHLEVVTNAENARRGDMAKLDWEKVTLIRASTESHAALARRFGVSPTAIHAVRAGLTWCEAA